MSEDRNYRVVDKRGSVCESGMGLATARCLRRSWDNTHPLDAPHRVQRVVFEDVPDPAPLPDDLPDTLWATMDGRDMHRPWLFDRWRDARNTADDYGGVLFRIPLPRDGWEEIE